MVYDYSMRMSDVVVPVLLKSSVTRSNHFENSSPQNISLCSCIAWPRNAKCNMIWNWTELYSVQLIPVKKSEWSVKQLTLLKGNFNYRAIVLCERVDFIESSLDYSSKEKRKKENEMKRREIRNVNLLTRRLIYWHGVTGQQVVSLFDKFWLFFFHNSDFSFFDKL